MWTIELCKYELKKKSTNTGDFYKISSLIKIEDYSSLRKLLFVTSWVLRFIKNLKSKLLHKKIETEEGINNLELEYSKQI